jgi:hypothetical protein
LQRWFAENFVRERPKGIVFVLTTDSDENESETDIFIFEKSYKIIAYLKFLEAHINSIYEKNVFLSECDSYEEAYKLALSMREPNPICYSN